MNSIKLQTIDTTLWNRYELTFQAHADVNILVGVNGSGKTTLLDQLYKQLLKETKMPERIVYLPSIDNLAIRDKRRNATALAQELDYYIYDMKQGPSLMYYRMSSLDASEEEQEKIKENIALFLDSVGSLFRHSRKELLLENNKLLIVSGNTRLTIDELSSGEKQILLILLRTFLLRHEEAVVLIDEPENSLDIEWQFELINLLVKLNPNAQYFITTHAPGIFGDGWGDRVIYMDQVTHAIE